MIPDDEPTVQPPDFCEIIDDDVERQKMIKKKTTTFDTLNTTPPSDENVTTSEGNKNKEETPEIDVIVLKIPELLAEANITLTPRSIEIATAAVIVNIIITTLVTLQLRTTEGSTNLNVHYFPKLNN